jgi:hypothetical protein
VADKLDFFSTKGFATLCRLKTSANKAKIGLFHSYLPAATDFRRQKMQQGLNNDYHSPRNNIRPSQGADHERSFQGSRPLRVLVAIVVIAAIIGGAWWFLEHRGRLAARRGAWFRDAIRHRCSPEGSIAGGANHPCELSRGASERRALERDLLELHFLRRGFQCLGGAGAEGGNHHPQRGAKKDIAALLSVAAHCW